MKTALAANDELAPPPEDDVLDIRGAAAFLKISRDALYDEVGRNGIPHRRIGNRIRFSRAALVRWLDAPVYKEP